MPPASVSLDDEGWRRIAWSDEQDRTAGSEDSINLAWDDRTAAAILLGDKSYISNGETFAERLSRRIRE